MKAPLRLTLFASLMALVAAPAQARPLAIVGATILDGNGGEPIPNGIILIDGNRITAVGDRNTPIPRGAERVGAQGKYVIPGMMDANVHLVYDLSPEFMLRYEDRFADIIKEGAQVALRSGFTTLFGTSGPLEELKAARDQINRGEAQGARLFVSANIVGAGGPLELDLFGPDKMVMTEEAVSRINAKWEQGVGKELVYMAPQEIRVRIREYLAKGVDFLKIGISGHGRESHGLYSFSAESLQVMMEEARAKGLSVQAHTMTAGALKISASGGYDLSQHCATAYRELPFDADRLQLIPDDIVGLVAARKLNCTMNAYTDAELRRHIGDIDGTVDLESIFSVPRGLNRMRRANVLATHQNERNLIQAGATILLSTDAGVPWIESAANDRRAACWRTPDECLHFLGTGHMAWFKAVQQMGMSPMRMLQAATHNIAAAYRKLDDLGTLEPGKLADLVILDADPLADFNNYRQIHLVMKEGQIVDRAALPVDKVLTPLNEPYLSAQSRP